MDSSTAQIGPDGGDALQASIGSATRALLGLRRPDGHWVFELEADCTIPAEYLLLRHYLGEPVDAVLEAKIANYLRRGQGGRGGRALGDGGAVGTRAGGEAHFTAERVGGVRGCAHTGGARGASPLPGGATPT